MLLERTQTCADRDCCEECCRQARELKVLSDNFSFFRCEDGCGGRVRRCTRDSDFEKSESCLAALTFKNPGIPFFSFNSLPVGCRGNGSLVTGQSALEVAAVGSFCSSSEGDLTDREMALLGGFVGCAVFFVLVVLAGIAVLMSSGFPSSKRCHNCSIEQ